MLVASSSEISALGIRLHLLTPLSISSSGYASDISMRVRFSIVYTRTHSSLFDSTNVPCVWYIFSSPTGSLHSGPKRAEGSYKDVLRSRRCQLDGSPQKICRAPNHGTKTNQYRIPTDSEYGRKGPLPPFCRPSHWNWFVGSSSMHPSQR